jgi:hypothetical protein
VSRVAVSVSPRKISLIPASRAAHVLGSKADPF